MAHEIGLKNFLKPDFPKMLPTFSGHSVIKLETTTKNLKNGKCLKI